MGALVFVNACFNFYYIKKKNQLWCFQQEKSHFPTNFVSDMIGLIGRILLAPFSTPTGDAEEDTPKLEVSVSVGTGIAGIWTNRPSGRRRRSAVIGSLAAADD